MQAPLRFVPFWRPMVWGSRRLCTFLNLPAPATDPYGEVWLVSDHAVHRSLVASGPWAGQSLRHLMASRAEALLGAAAKAYAAFPWLIKFLDISDRLSVQVHPDETAVQQLWPGEKSKTEAWFVIDAAPGSCIYAGLLPGVDEAVLRARLRDGAVADCLHRFQPRPGDCIFLPAGTVHAAGGGVLLAEIQQTSDATFRLFDWNRRDAQGAARTLHLEQGLASIHWNQGPVHPIQIDDLQGAGEEAAGSRRQALAVCPYFGLEYCRSSEPFLLAGGCLQALVVLEGKGRLATPDGDEEITRGQVWVMPAAMPPSWCFPNGRLVVLICRL